MLWMPLVTAAFLGYFGYHAFTGAFGLQSMDRLVEEAAALSSQLAALRDQRQALETKVARVRPDSLDADLVDFQCTQRPQRDAGRRDDPCPCRSAVEIAGGPSAPSLGVARRFGRVPELQPKSPP